MINNINTLGTSTGKIVYSIDDFQDVFSIPTAEIIELFKTSGIILFRGFGINAEKMKNFSKQFSDKHFRDHTKTSINSDEFINFVDNGIDSRVAHSEHAYSPFRPDVIWFCCIMPAADGGETLFWDGVRVWEELSHEIKQLFIDKKLKYSHTVSPNIWKMLTGSDGTIEELKQMLDNIQEVNYQINEDKTVSMEYTCSAVVKTKYGNQDAFANSFWVYQKKSQEAIFDDGSRASDEVEAEIQKVLDRLTEEIPWQAGDLVMIDNSRFLHGRRAFNDQRRQIFTTLSNLNF